MANRNATILGPYLQRSVRARIEAFFLDNLGKVATREQLIAVATDPETKRTPENWHQRLSELRTDMGYTILSWRNRGDLRVSEYMMPNAERRATAARRTRPTAATWKQVLVDHDHRCAWTEGGISCALRDGDTDPVGGRCRQAHARPQDPSCAARRGRPSRSVQMATALRSSSSHEEELLG